MAVVVMGDRVVMSIRDFSSLTSQESLRSNEGSAGCLLQAGRWRVKPQCGVQNFGFDSRHETKFEGDERIDQRWAVHDTVNIFVATMDVRMTDQPAEALPLLQEDKLRQIARHVKDYIPGNGAGDIDEQKM